MNKKEGLAEARILKKSPDSDQELIDRIDILATLLAAWRVAMETPLSSTSSSEMMAGHESLNIEKEKSRPENAHPNTLTPVQSKIEHFNSRPREFTFIAIICMAQLMTQAALGQAIAPLHIIGSSFGVTNPGQLSMLLHVLFAI